MNVTGSSGSPPISVLMSCYNGSRWLPEALDSVLGQTFANFEFIVVDDGSVDATPRILREYEGRDGRLRVLLKQNTGLADSLNAGLSLARGTWIARVDQDDICEPSRLERQLEFAASRSGLVLLGSGFSEIDERGSLIGVHSYPGSHRGLSRRLERLQGFFPHSSAFYLAAAARGVGGYNRRISRAEDWRLWLELSLKGELSCLREPLVRIRKHSGQMSWDASGSRQLFDAAAATACHFLRKAGLPDPSTAPDLSEWESFRAWVEERLLSEGFLDHRKAWWEVRAAYVAAGGGPVALARFSARVLASRYALQMLGNKLFGSNLPRRLAAEWARGSGGGR
ncbi:MAG: glycosyltransferase family 2 protein [Elusimicrobia bacterium]|nr:glycosyltransferase family 2 protein [Elusimicrobiota bacterium]